MSYDPRIHVVDCQRLAARRDHVRDLQHVSKSTTGRRSLKTRWDPENEPLTMTDCRLDLKTSKNLY